MIKPVALQIQNHNLPNGDGKEDIAQHLAHVAERELGAVVLDLERADADLALGRIAHRRERNADVLRREAKEAALCDAVEADARRRRVAADHRRDLVLRCERRAVQRDGELDALQSVVRQGPRALVGEIEAAQRAARRRGDDERLGAAAPDLVLAQHHRLERLARVDDARRDARAVVGDAVAREIDRHKRLEGLALADRLEQQLAAEIVEAAARQFNGAASVTTAASS